MKLTFKQYTIIANMTEEQINALTEDTLPEGLADLTEANVIKSAWTAIQAKMAAAKEKRDKERIAKQSELRNQRLAATKERDAARDKLSDKRLAGNLPLKPKAAGAIDNDIWDDALSADDRKMLAKRDRLKDDE